MKLTKEQMESEIENNRRELASTDYIIIRQMEQQTLSQEAYAEVVAKRQAIRDNINALEVEAEQAGE